MRILHFSVFLRQGSEGIILPHLNYRTNSTRTTKDDKDMKENSKKKENNSEILSVLDLLEEITVKIIDESKAPTGITAAKLKPTTPTVVITEETQPSVGVALEPAYQPNKLVSDVWKSRESGVSNMTHLYRYTNFNRLVYPPGFGYGNTRF